MREVVALEGLSRGQWLRARQAGIGGSDVAAIMGLDPWGDAFSVYVSKITDTPEADDQSSPIMRLGQLLEDGIANAYAEETGSHVTKPDYLYAHDQHDWMLANIDRFTDNEGPGVLEVKMSSASERWDAGLPEAYELQVLHYMAVTELPYADVAALLHGRDLRLFRVERDDATIAHLIQIERDFWRRVEDRDPPPPGPNSAAALKRLYGQSHPDAIELPAEMGEIIDAYRQAKLDEKALAQHVELLRNTICGGIGEHETGLIGGIPAATWKPSLRTNVDLTAVERDHPGLLDAYRRATPVRTLRIRKGWE